MFGRGHRSRTFLNLLGNFIHSPTFWKPSSSTPCFSSSFHFRSCLLILRYIPCQLSRNETPLLQILRRRCPWSHCFWVNSPFTQVPQQTTNDATADHDKTNYIGRPSARNNHCFLRCCCCCCFSKERVEIIFSNSWHVKFSFKKIDTWSLAIIYYFDSPIFSNFFGGRSGKPLHS